MSTRPSPAPTSSYIQGMADTETRSYGIAEGHPFIRTHFEVWWNLSGKWGSIHPAELSETGAVMTKAKFDSEFPDLPPLPPGAFARRQP
jgi:hypothetical protein